MSVALGGITSGKTFSEIAFIDSGVSDTGALIAGMRPGVEAIVLAPDRSAPQQIAEAVAGRTLKALHIMAHGRPGEVSFSAGPLALNTLGASTTHLAVIGEALAGHGSLLLWSCESGQAAHGKAFVQALAAATGARVAAARQRIGAAALGGCWDLDELSSEIAVRVPLTPEATANYAGVMAIVNATAGEDIFTGLGGPNNTTAGNDTIIYTAGNQVDNTLADPANGVARNQDSIDGGAGFDTIQAGAAGNGVTIDFGKASLVAPVAPPALFFNIEGLSFGNTAGTGTAKLLAEQFGAGLISEALAVTGVLGSAQAINISFLDAQATGGTFDASGWTFTNWTPGTDTITILGSAEADVITGTTAADHIDGNTGNDTINLANGYFAAGESINGGTNAVAGTDADRLVLTNATTVDFTTGILTQIEILTGSAGDDNLTMSLAQWGNFTTSIDLGAGTNTLNVAASTIGVIGGGGGGGAAGTPASISNVTTGNLVGTTGTDTVTISGEQIDAIIIGAGTIDLGAGTDTINLTSTSADLNILGATDASIAGVEVISVAGAAAGATITLSGQTEGFTITGGGGADTITGGAGADIISAGGGADTISSGGGADVVTGGAAADTINAGAGDDIINLASGDFAAGESIDGGADADMIVLINNVTVDFSAGTIAAVETLTGSAASDTVTMSAAQWTGFTTIDLGGAANTLNVVAAGDISAAPTPALLNITTGNLRGTAGNDSITLTGAQLDAILIGGGTIDLGLGATDTMNLTSTSADLNTLGASNNAIANVEVISAASATAGVSISLAGQLEAFSLAGGAGGDSLTGGSGADSINGGDGNDVLAGGAGSDTINGGSGNDTITGGSGADTLSGGTDGDQFNFAAGDSALAIAGNLTAGTLAGFDVITDFAPGSGLGTSDTVGFAGAAVAADTASTDGANSVLQLHTGAQAATHSIVNGIVKFDDAAPFATAVPLQTTADVAAAVQYLQANNLGGGGVSVAFTATLAGVAHTFVFIQGDAAGTNSQDELIDLPNVTATSIVAAAGQINVFVAPVANPDSLQAIEDTPVTYTAASLLGNDINASSIASVTSGTGGTAVLNANGTVTFTPDANFNGPASFSYIATDGVLNSTSGAVTVNVAAVNDAPVAVADTGTAVEAGVVAGSDATGNVLANDTDVDTGDTKTVTTTGAVVGTHGTLTLNADGSYSYAVNNADLAVNALRLSTDTLTDTFSYTMSDAAGATSSANLAITIHGANDAPVAIDDTGTAVEAGVAAGSNATGNVLANDTDVDTGDSKTVTTTGALVGTHGTLTLNANGSYSYALDNADAAVNALRLPADTLTDTFSYTVHDTAGATSTANLTITIQGANDAPVAVADTGIAVEAGVVAGSNATGNVLANDTDVDAGDSKTVTTPTAPGGLAGAHGTLTLNADGSYSYAVNNADVAVNALRLPTDTLTDTFNYTMVDAAGVASSAALTVTIQGANDAPVAADDAGTAVKAGASAGTNANGNVLANDTDVDSGDTKTVTNPTAPGGLAGAHGTLTLNAGGSYSYAVDNADAAVIALRLPTDTLTDTFSYTVSDTAGAASTANLVITIHGANEAPVITAGGISAATPILTPENITSVAILTATDADVPVQALTWSIAPPAAGYDNGLFAIDSTTGALNFIAAPDFENPAHSPLYKLAVNVSDGIATTTRDVFVNVTDVAPVITDINDTIGRTILGTAENDTISGLRGNDRIFGRAGNDTILGGAGNDFLSGEAGDDTLTGGAGKDRMTGGAGADVFDFNRVVESGTAAATRDVITDFKHLTDKIDLKDIDASAKLLADQAFKFIGQQAFHHVAGELRHCVANAPNHHLP